MVLKRPLHASVRPSSVHPSVSPSHNISERQKCWKETQAMRSATRTIKKFSCFHRQDTTGFYAYIQARDQAPEDKAFLESEYFMASDIDRCLDFYYHMNGDHIGR